LFYLAVFNTRGHLCIMIGLRRMSLAKAHRMILAALRAAKKEGAASVEVIEGETTVRIWLLPDTPLPTKVSELDEWKAKHAR
jgi:hypothetical protein